MVANQASPCRQHSSHNKSSHLCEDCEEIHRAEELMMRGKRNMCCNMIQEATDAFANACEIFAGQFGEESDQMAIPYLNYGKALLEMGKIENGILGNAVKQSKDLLSDENKDEKPEEKSDFIADDTEEINEAEMKEQVWNSMSKDNMYADPANTAHAQDPLREVCDDHAPDGASQDGDVISQDGDMSQDDDATADDNQDDGIMASEDTEPEESNLQHAWNILEISAKIWRRNGEPASLKLAETKMILGHVSMETESYEKAVEDFTEALQLMRKFMVEDDRRIAETMYNVGLAHSFNNKFSDSITWFKESRGVLEKRVANLDARIRQQTAEEFGKLQTSEELEEMRNEHRELSDIVMFDMTSKIQDVESAIQSFSNTMKAQRGSSFSQQADNQFDASAYDSAAGKFVDANQISVKRKSSVDGSVEHQKRVAHDQMQVDQNMEQRCDA